MPAVRSVPGSAEEIPVPDASLDAVLAGQSPWYCGRGAGSRPPGCDRATAGPRDQFGLEDEPAVLMLVGPVGLVQQELGGGPAELVLGLAYRGERDRGVGGKLDVVVADHGEVRGYRHPGLAQPPR